MTKKLYTVRCSFDYAVLADNEREAHKFADEAVKDTPLDDCCYTLIPGDNGKAQLPMGWTKDCLVYNASEDTEFCVAQDTFEVGK